MSATGMDSGDSSTKGRIDRELYTVEMQDAKTDATVKISYTNVQICGHGSFGVVCKAQIVSASAAGARTGMIALKKTKQDRRFKNRELQLMKVIDHPNIVKLLYYQYEQEDPVNAPEEITLHLALELHPQTIYAFYRNYTKQHQHMPEVLVKLHMYQLLRAVAYLHSLGICHRDLKPHNILVNPATGVTTLIDFGSAKMLKSGQTNIAYTCSRWYRAPELIFCSTQYTHAIDIWSVGCILGELLLGSVLFPGTSSVDQLVEIIKVLGTPTRDQVLEMNPSYRDHVFPQIKSVPWTRLLPASSHPAQDLISSFLVYDPNQRLPALEALLHPFFDDLKQPPSSPSDSTGPRPPRTIKLPNGKPFSLPPQLFEFSLHELSIQPALSPQLVPTFEHANILRRTGVDLSLKPRYPVGQEQEPEPESESGSGVTAGGWDVLDLKAVRRRVSAGID